MGSFNKKKELIIQEISEALSEIEEDKVQQLIEDILLADRVFLTGVGRVYLSLQAFTKRLSHLGIDAHCVGDITEPAFTEKSLLIVGSGSGCSIVPVAIAKKAYQLKGKIVHIGSNPNGDVSKYIDYMIRIPVRTRLYLTDEIDSKQPMTSLFEQSLYIFADTISMMIIEKKDIRDLETLWMYHANLE